MTVAPLSLLALVAQAPMGRLEVTTTEGIVVVCIMIGLLVVAFWMRWRQMTASSIFNFNRPGLDQLCAVAARDGAVYRVVRHADYVAMVDPIGNVKLPRIMPADAIYLALHRASQIFST